MSARSFYITYIILILYIRKFHKYQWIICTHKKAVSKFGISNFRKVLKRFFVCLLDFFLIISEVLGSWQLQFLLFLSVDHSLIIESTKGNIKNSLIDLLFKIHAFLSRQQPCLLFPLVLLKIYVMEHLWGHTYMLLLISFIDEESQ